MRRTRCCDAHGTAQSIFAFYCKFGRTSWRGLREDSLDSFNFMKLCRECPGLMDARLTRTIVDLIFVRCKPKFERRLSYGHFLDALAATAAHKFPAEEPAAAFSLLLMRCIARVCVCVPLA